MPGESPPDVMTAILFLPSGIAGGWRLICAISKSCGGVAGYEDTLSAPERLAQTEKRQSRPVLVDVLGSRGNGGFSVSTDVVRETCEGSAALGKYRVEGWSLLSPNLGSSATCHCRSVSRSVSLGSRKIPEEEAHNCIGASRGVRAQARMTGDRHLSSF
jgi:hypothetical protein